MLENEAISWNEHAEKYISSHQVLREHATGDLRINRETFRIESVPGSKSFS